MAALGLLGDTEALRAELGKHTGLLTATMQVDGLALLSLALCSDDPIGPARELSELAARGYRDGKLARLYAARLVRAFSDVAQAFSGKPLSPSSRSLLGQGAMEGGMVEVVILRALQRALRASEDVKAAAESRGAFETSRR
jgi:hypothetical protein